MALTSLKLSDLTDRDLLFVVEESGDKDGWATSKEVAERLGIDNPHPAQCVGTRLGWLRRYRVPLELKEFEGETFWRIPDETLAIMRPPKLSAATERAIEGLSESQRVLVTETVARQAAGGSAPLTHLTRRAWNHSMAGWRDPSLNTNRKKSKKSKKKSPA